MPRRGDIIKLEHLLLGVLLERPQTGYDLKKSLDTSGRRFLRAKTQMSQVYRTLSSMERDCWVTYELEKRTRAQAGKVYSATPEGAVVFFDWLKGAYHPTNQVIDVEFGARLTFAGFLTVEEVLDLLDIEIRAREEQIGRFRLRDRTTILAPTAPYDERLAATVSELLHAKGAAAVDAHIEWCENLRQTLAGSRCLDAS